MVAALVVFALTYLAIAAGRVPWLAAALASTLAGNLTMMGSVANVIVLELAGPKGRVGYWPFLRSGVVVTGATLLVGLAILLAERRMGWF
jgi:Na+/H+ antiporter NhaD/arsenite permease-like protein